MALHGGGLCEEKGLNGPGGGGGPKRRENVEWPWEGAYARGKS